MVNKSTKKLTTEVFIARAIEKFGKRYKFSKTNYVNKRTKVIITCRVHGDFEVYPLTFLKSKHGCKDCGYISMIRFQELTPKGATKRPNKGSFKKFVSRCKEFDDYYINKAKIVHKDKYTYKKLGPIKNIEKDSLLITCPIHGNFKQTIKNHLLGQGCPKCAYSIKTDIEINKILQKRFTDCYIKTTGKELLTKEYIDIYCTKHGKSTNTVKHILRGLGCPKCVQYSGFRKDKPAILYYLSINNGQAYKIGITNKRVEARFDKTDLKNIRIIRTWYYENGQECYEQEQKLLQKFKSDKYEGLSLLKSGNTELFKLDILNLDKNIEEERIFNAKI